MREIGSEFHFSSSHYRLSRRLSSLSPGHSYFLRSGRDCLSLLIESLPLGSRGAVLLPAYLCAEVLRPFSARGIPLEFYGLNRDLSIDLCDVKKKYRRRSAPSYTSTTSASPSRTRAS